MVTNQLPNPNYAFYYVALGTLEGNILSGSVFEKP